MKKGIVWLLAVMLLLTGCKNNQKFQDISVSDARYPYSVTQKGEELLVQFQTDADTDVIWQVEVMPEAVCMAEQEDAKEETVNYRITGGEQGLAEIVFTASRADETGEELFNMTVVADVDEKGHVRPASARHEETKAERVETEALSYQWEVGMDGNLQFSLLEETASIWSMEGDGGDVCALSQLQYMRDKCFFTAEPLTQGSAAVVLTCQEPARNITVHLAVDKDLQITVESVQE